MDSARVRNFSFWGLACGISDSDSECGSGLLALGTASGMFRSLLEAAAWHRPDRVSPSAPPSSSGKFASACDASPRCCQRPNAAERARCEFDSCLRAIRSRSRSTRRWCQPSLSISKKSCNTARAQLQASPLSPATRARLESFAGRLPRRHRWKSSSRYAPCCSVVRCMVSAR